MASFTSFFMFQNLIAFFFNLPSTESILTRTHPISLSDVFPGIEYNPSDLDKLKEHIHCVASERHLVVGDVWCQKVVQLYQIQNIQHGLIMVGPSATGKAEAWRVLLAALGRFEGHEGVSYVIDPKAISKESLYGMLDPPTWEWNNGLFTNILQKIIDNVRGKDAKWHWIIFDGDVDPVWVENVNSALDYNKLLTLSNGERLNLPDNVQIMFKVKYLKYSTLATVSRCGMVWFSGDAVTPDMFCQNYLKSAHYVALDAIEDNSLLIEPRGHRGDSIGKVSANLITQRNITKILAPHFETDSLVTQSLNYAASVNHIMELTIAQAVSTLFSPINKTIQNVLDYNVRHSDFPLQQEQIEAYAKKRFLIATVWAFTGDSKLDTRAQMGFFLRDHSGLDMPPLHEPGASLIDYNIQVSSGNWVAWQSSVPIVEIDTCQVTTSDVVIPTLDSVRHKDVLYSWLSEHKPLILCGPPGSGKTMTLFSALRKLSEMDVVGLNFSSATAPELVLKTFDQHCGGFWRPLDKVWIKLERIRFFGDCNPPTDPGQVTLSQRFLRHAPLVMVDYPGEASLKQIYGMFIQAVLKV
ncbi:hypothetical protein BY996DRAFT_6412712 [Phakopsora pachyrhizi]|nr:hypothetical protein BY996DRAFT_6412712 [Phakopsora pachyrhizi]